MGPRSMRTNRNTGVNDREQWRARILAALAELRHEDRMLGTSREDERGDDDEGRGGTTSL